MFSRDQYCLSSLLLLISCITLVCCNNTKNNQPNIIPLASNRAYSGAPPTINHKVQELGREECISCHLDGNAMDKGKKTPITSHPELIRCRQCHVEKITKETFVHNSFQGHTYEIGLRSQPMGPPLIPHPMTMRENCLGCHGNEAINDRLKTGHPERVRCLQCHIPAHSEYPKSRPNLKSAIKYDNELVQWSL